MGRPHLVCQPLSSFRATVSITAIFVLDAVVEHKDCDEALTPSLEVHSVYCRVRHRMLAERFLYLTTFRPTLKTLVFALLYARYIEPK